MMNMSFPKSRESFSSLRTLWIRIVAGWGVVLENGGSTILIADRLVRDVTGSME